MRFPTQTAPIQKVVTARQYNQDASGVKRAASAGPVVITERGRPAHVMMSWSAYRQLLGTQAGPSLTDFLAGLDLDGLELERSGDTGRDAPF